VPLHRILDRNQMVVLLAGQADDLAPSAATRCVIVVHEKNGTVLLQAAEVSDHFAFAVQPFNPLTQARVDREGRLFPLALPGRTLR
jgi:hypothetical protein